jgi:hypothetical protein
LQINKNHPRRRQPDDRLTELLEPTRNSGRIRRKSAYKQYHISARDTKPLNCARILNILALQGQKHTNVIPDKRETAKKYSVFVCAAAWHGSKRKTGACA